MLDHPSTWSRGHVQTLRVYVAAMKMHIVIVELDEHELGFMAGVLEDTLCVSARRC